MKNQNNRKALNIIYKVKTKKLTKIALSNLELEEIPVELFELDTLTHVWLDNNKLKNIPSEIKKLKKLTHNWLGNNNLECLPDELINSNVLIN